jgi:hypothetical protein
MVCEVSDNTLCSTVEASRESNFLLDDHFEDFIRIIVHERASANHHFINEHSKAVPINCLTVTFIHDDLRSQVFRSAAKSVGPFSRF